MLTMDIFNDDAFSATELTEGINEIPNQWGRIGEMGLFRPKAIRTTTFALEFKAGVLTLIQSTTRGTDLPGAARSKRKLRSFDTLRFGLQDTITADDIAGIRSFGKTTELMQVQDLVADSQETIRGSIDITREYLRAGALQGQVKDADGTVILDLFNEFGVTQKVVDFDLGNGSPSLMEKSNEVKRHIELNLKGDVMTGVGALVTPTAWDKLMKNEEFKEAYKYFQNMPNPLREDVRKGFKHQGIYWEEYLAQGDVPQEDGTTVTQNFIPEGDIRFYPMGTRTTFRQYNAPADYIETVNTPGTDFYSAVIMPDRRPVRSVGVEGQMNTMPIAARPAVLVRGHSST